MLVEEIHTKRQIQIQIKMSQITTLIAASFTLLTQYSHYCLKDSASPLIMSLSASCQTIADNNKENELISTPRENHSQRQKVTQDADNICCKKNALITNTNTNANTNANANTNTNTNTNTTNIKKKGWQTWRESRSEDTRCGEREALQLLHLQKMITMQV